MADGTDAPQKSCDGSIESLIAGVSRISDLRVVSRTSSMYYRDSTKTLPVIAKELDVDLVVEHRTQLAAALQVHPLFEPVRQAVAFQALMRKVGLS